MTTLTTGLVGLGCLAFVAFTVTGMTGAALLGLFRAGRLLFRLAWWVISRPRLSIPLGVAGLLTWLAWPILQAVRGDSGGGSSSVPLIVVGAVGTLSGALLLGWAIVQQHRIGRDLEAEWEAGPVVDDDGSPTAALPEWARE
jgi:hypothetical protein